MTTVNLALSDELKTFVEAEAVRRGFGDIGDYLRSIILQEKERDRRRTHVDSLLLEGLDSGPATPLTASDWDAMRRRLRDRHATSEE
jgi:antitoxin ParD1/3/4